MARAVRALRERLGDEAMSELQGVVDDADQKWREDVIAIAAERFERRLGAEAGALRLDMAKEFATVRVDMARECSAVRSEMVNGLATVRSEMADGLAAVRGEMARELAAVRVEMASGFATTRADLLKWSFLFWIGQFAAITGMMAFLLRTIR